MRIGSLIATLVVSLAAAPMAAAAPAYIVVDVGQGAVIADRDANRLWHPASVTKLMTAYLTFKALKNGELKLTSPVTISANALAEPPAKMGFKVGTVLTVDNALKMMIVKSANDIAVALAETVGGSEARFVTLMNATARSLGMASTRFRNPNGLPDDAQVTTARDLAVLARTIWLEFPEYRDMFKIPAIKAGRRVLRSPNTLLERYRGANGMKTGFICSSGFNVVASATRNGRTLIAVVLGAESSMARAEAAAKLLDNGFVDWSIGARPQLASFKTASAPGGPVDMKEAVCGKNRHRGEDDDSLLAKLGSTSLGPPIATMAPVVVFTGKADPAPGATPAAAAAAVPDAGPAPAKGKPAPGIPLPRPRPQYAAGASAAGGKTAQ